MRLIGQIMLMALLLQAGGLGAQNGISYKHPGAHYCEFDTTYMYYDRMQFNNFIAVEEHPTPDLELIEWSDDKVVVFSSYYRDVLVFKEESDSLWLYDWDAEAANTFDVKLRFSYYLKVRPWNDHIDTIAMSHILRGFMLYMRKDSSLYTSAFDLNEILTLPYEDQKNDGDSMYLFPLEYPHHYKSKVYIATDIVPNEAYRRDSMPICRFFEVNLKTFEQRKLFEISYPLFCMEEHCTASRICLSPRLWSYYFYLPRVSMVVTENRIHFMFNSIPYLYTFDMEDSSIFRRQLFFSHIDSLDYTAESVNNYLDHIDYCWVYPWKNDTLLIKYGDMEDNDYVMAYDAAKEQYLFDFEEFLSRMSRYDRDYLYFENPVPVPAFYKTEYDRETGRFRIIKCQICLK